MFDQAAAMDPEDLQRRGSPGPDASYKPVIFAFFLKPAVVLLRTECLPFHDQKKNPKSRRSSKVNTEDSAEDEEVDGQDKSKTVILFFFVIFDFNRF